MNKFVLYLVVAFILIAGGAGFYLWQQSQGVTLRDDLPPAPRGYDTINEDPAVVAEIPEERREQYRKEFETVLQIIAEHPDSFAAWLNLGSSKSDFGDYKGAEEAWLYATELVPNQVRTYMNLADLYWNKTKEYEKAEQALLAAIENDGGDLERTRAYRDLASLYRYSFAERKDKAIEVLRIGIEELADNAELLALAGMWSWEDGKLDDAIGFYEEYLLKNPENEAARSDLQKIRQQKAGQ